MEAQLSQYPHGACVCIYVQGSPSGCVQREIPGVTQVEKGHEGNTAVLVVTAYICWRKHEIHLS